MIQPKLFGKGVRVRKKQAHPESDLQRLCVKFFRLQYPKYRNLLFSIPNGAVTSAFQRQMLVANGLVNGVSDLMLAIPSKQYHGLFLEMKVGKNTLSDHQKEFKKNVEGQGYLFVTCFSFTEFQKIITEYLS